MQSIEHLEDTERKNTHSLNFLQTLTQDKGIHDDTRDGCSNQKAKGCVHVEIRSKSSTNPKDCLDCQANEDDDPPTIPGRRQGIYKVKIVLMQQTAHGEFKVAVVVSNSEEKNCMQTLPSGACHQTYLSAKLPNTIAPTRRPNM